MQAKFSLAISLSKSALKTVCPWTCFWSFVIFVIAIQGCALQKSKGILWLSNCEIQGVWHMIFMKILRFPSHQRAKVRHQGCSSTFRAQHCTQPFLMIYVYVFFVVVLFLSLLLLLLLGSRDMHVFRQEAPCSQGSCVIYLQTVMDQVSTLYDSWH